MEKRLKTAVIYARYSSENQTEQSIEGQLRVCSEYAKSHDILILDTYIDRAKTAVVRNGITFWSISWIGFPAINMKWLCTRKR